jgi:disulfide bond formation protein DsbB
MSSTNSHRRQPLGIQPRELRGSNAKEYLIRFAFGAGVSAAAALITAVWGPRIGGTFLAFPAILPASLTLIERQRGTAEATSDAKGGQLGGLGLIAFGLVAWQLLPRLAPTLALFLALAAWCVVATGAYLILRRVLPVRWGYDRS